MRWRWLLGLAYLGALTHPLLDLLTTYSVQLFSPFSALWYHADGLFIIDIWLWLLLGGTLFFSKRREKKGREWRRPMQAAIAVMLAYIGANLALSQAAYAQVRAEGREALFASPPPFFPWRRDLVWREGDCYRRAHYDPLAGGVGPLSDCSPSNMRDPLVRRAVLEDPSLRKFLRWSVMPQAVVTRGKCEARVTIGDARYGDRGSSRLNRETLVQTC